MLSLRARKALLAAAVAVALPVTGAIITVPGGAAAAVAPAKPPPPPPPPPPTPTPTQTVICPPDNGGCQGSIGVPGGPGGTPTGSGGPGGGGGTVCTHNGVVVACYDPRFGYYDQFDDCYYLIDSPQPPTGDPSRQGHPLGDGNVYIRTCLGATGPGGPANNQVLVWLPDPPPGQPNAPTDAQRAANAIGLLQIAGPKTGITPIPDKPGQPGSGGTGLVGLATWLWTDTATDAKGVHWAGPGAPISTTIPIPGYSLTLVATSLSISWDMDNGRVVLCNGPGVPFDPKNAGQNPSCGFRYFKPGDYHVVGTTAWHVTWSATDGNSGVIDVQRSAPPVTIHIRQLEVVTR